MDAISHQTGEIFTFKPSRFDVATLVPNRSPEAIKVEKFMLLNQVKNIMPSHRTASCLTYQRRTGMHYSDGKPQLQPVEIWKSPKSNQCHYKGLTVCSRVWTCPVCTSKINEKRRLELRDICQSHQANGGHILMVTKTFSHEKFDDLKEMLTGLSKANDRFWRCPAIKRLRELLGVVGYVRATEVTWGKDHGWHPHYHELWLISNPRRLSDIEDVVFDKWKQFIKKVGLGLPNKKYGVDVRGADDAWAYVTKFGQDVWDYTHEMTRHHVKKSKSGGFSPFALLKASIARMNDGDIDPAHAAKLFRVYAEALHGRRQLQYSIGLKAMFQVDDLTDEQIAESAEEEASLVAQLTNDEWSKIIYSWKSNSRANALIVAANGGKEALDRYLSSLPEPPSSYRP